jgi:oligoribonuclease (3'-5' exoribonuclease)
MQNIEINNDILNKAENIINKKKEEEKEEKAKIEYIEKCIEAKICPICGNELHLRPASKEDKKKHFYDYYYDTLFCEKDEFIKINGDYSVDDYD